MRRALVPLVLTAALAGCGIVAGLGDAPSYVESNDGAPGVGGANVTGVGGAGVTGAGGSTNQPDGSVANAGGAIGASGNDLGRGGDETVTMQSEASVISNCRGATCPVDAGIVTPEAGPCAAPGASCIAMPVGWQPAALTQMGLPCPSGFGNSQAFYTSAKGENYTCSCGCAGTQSCSGTATLNEYSNEAGAGCTGTPTTRQVSFSPSCQTGNSGDILTGNSYALSNVVYGPGPACSSAPTATSKPTPTVESTTVCTASAICPSGACLNFAEERSLCIQKAGINMCPSNFPQISIMSAKVDDTRTCGACSCGSSLICQLLGVVLDNDYACSLGHPYVMTANDYSCQPAPSNFPCNATIAQHKISGTGACAETAPSVPAGTVGLNTAATITVCCK